LALSRNRFPGNSVWVDPRFQFVSGADVSQFFGQSPLFACQETDKILWVEWPAAVQLHGLLLQQLKNAFRTQLRDRAANLLTHFQNGRMYFKNVVGNFRFQGDADVGSLFGKFHDVPMVIVSAGPSLDRNVRELRGIENYCFLLAVDTALRPLLEAGIVPHAVIMADPTELNAKHVVGVLPEEVFLIAEQGVHQSALEAASRRFLYGLGLFPDPLFFKYGYPRTRLDVWGSVSTAALDLACKIGANPVILTGQDFAYSWNRDYARHTIFDGLGFDPSRLPGVVAKDIWNHDTPTTENLVAYRDFFVRRMKSEERIRFINATEGGILTQGAEILSLKDALFHSCPRRIYAERILQSCHHTRRVTNAALDHLKLALGDPANGCGCREGFLDLVAKESVLKKDQVGLEAAAAWGLALMTEASLL